MTRFIRRILFVIAAIIILGAGWLGYQNRDDGWRASAITPQPAWHHELEMKAPVLCQVSVTARGEITALSGDCPEATVRRMMQQDFVLRSEWRTLKDEVYILKKAQRR